MAAPKLTLEQIDEIVYLREEDGLANAPIAARFGVSVGTVNWHCLRLGVPSNVVPLGDRGPMIRYRNGRPVRRFTPAEDARLIELASTHSRKAIGRLLGRGQRSIVARLMTLARRQEAA